MARRPGSAGHVVPLLDAGTTLACEGKSTREAIRCLKR
jgi:hypothetical protein